MTPNSYTHLVNFGVKCVLVIIILYYYYIVNILIGNQRCSYGSNAGLPGSFTSIAKVCWTLSRFT